MPTRTAEAVWKGTLKDGQGELKVDSGAFEGPYSFASRFEEESGTNPEELIGAAHAGCFSMFLSAVLSKEGLTPTRIATRARVHLETPSDGPRISRIELETEAEVPGLDEEAFLQHAETSKKNCPVSKALSGTEILLSARLIRS